MSTPLFLVLEGPDGVGTTTLARLLAERLQREGLDVLLTAEPTDGPIGTVIRDLLKGTHRMPSDALQLLFTADRAQHVHEVIEPALASHGVVVCDRYIPSTLAYGRVSGEPQFWLRELNKNFIQPARTFYLTAPVEVCFERLGKRSSRDSFEERGFQERVHTLYKELAAEDANGVEIRNDRSPVQTLEEIWKSVGELLPARLA